MTYVPPTELETQFVAHLAEMSKDVQWEYERWLETPSGECSDDSYCQKCAEIQRWINRHQKNQFTRISGWDDSTAAADSPKWCERCGVLLWHALTDYGWEEELECWRTGHVFPVSASDAAIMHNALTCGGAYEGDRAKWWPLLEPIARQILTNRTT